MNLNNKQLARPETVEDFLFVREYEKLFREEYEEDHERPNVSNVEKVIERSLSAGSQPNAIKYINFIRTAEALIENPELRANYVNKFLEVISPKFTKQGNTVNNHDALMKEIIDHYKLKLIAEDYYKIFISKF